MKPETLWNAVDWRAVARDEHLVLLTDLDGTLIPFASAPEEADLDDAAAGALETLVRLGVRVVAVSGRPKALVESLRQRVPGAWWIAEHGGWFCADAGWSCAAPGNDELETLGSRLSALVDAFAGARVERKTASVCLHWRGVADPLRGALLDAADVVIEEWLENHPDHERMAGVLMLEVAPRGRHKGAAVTWVRDRIPDARIIAIGDDVTDERMFAALGSSDLAIAVGSRRPSRADLAVDDVAGARRLLGWLADVRAGRSVLPAPARVARRSDRRCSLLVVSNRMPSPELDGRRRQVGGLVAALEPALRDRDATWIGWSGLEGDGAPAVTIDSGAAPARATFDLAPHLRERFYGGFCNRSLWPLLHGFPSRVRYDDDEWAAYVEANDVYARLAADLVDPDGTIWVHDYHLFLLAAGLRHRGHRGPIGMFLHVPFPPLDVIETLPWADQLMDAMLAFDLLGFHTSHWALNFRGAAKIIAATRDHHEGIQHRRGITTAAVFPLGIDAEPFRHDRPHIVSPDVAGLREALRGRKLLLGVDRLDYSKGIPERLEAFERLLERYPGWRGEVCFVQVSVPSRADVPEYAELRRRVEHLVGKINGRFGEADWTPVRYLYRAYDHEVLAQLYRAADVAVVTPLRDGMNLVAKEFVAAQDPDRPGVLVLSRFAGAAEQLRAAVLTNPFHRDGLADDLHRALSMPLDERRESHALLRESVLASTPTTWADDFLGALEAHRTATYARRAT